MSDDFDDEFLVDDSFLREVDNIAAKASGSLPVTNGRGWTGVQKAVPSGSRGLNGRSVSVGSALQPNSIKKTPTRQQPSSNDFDDLSLNADALVALDSASTTLVHSVRSASKVPSRPVNPSTIPSSRLARTTSNPTSEFFQTHLNFHRPNQSTKGKRWDRTIFAETGRRIGAEKAKAKGKKGYQARHWARDDDEEDLDDLDDEEEEDGDPLVPPPKPLVDMNKPYGPQRHFPNKSTINTYIYPTNRPKRDYQFDIVKACFTDNCLVALPTGLGKTFVAGVVMLNFYRWFPSGKIVFLAPTKPLVNQQIEACQMTCGIPSADAAVLTGQSVSGKDRVKLWEDRRVFYCTPQTLENDLKNGRVDPKDIVLAVFDEAHKASGSYAYTTILAYITAHHPFFRVLALTATPGADVPRVQAVADALHISRIEIREAEAPEIRKYMNDKITEKHVVPMGEVIEGFRDRWAALLKPQISKLVTADILNERDLDIKRLKTFRLTSKRMEILRDHRSSCKWAIGTLNALEKCARAMGHLLEFSIGMFHTILTEIAGNSTALGKKATSKGSSNSMRNNTEFQRLLRDVEAELNCIRMGEDGRTKADRHPKMVKTTDLLLNHFTEAAEDERVHGVKNDTRAMVFCSFRECVMEVVDMLNEHSGLIKATKFVGQSQGKQDADKGFNQKEQRRTIADFKEGKYNVLVSTSIGEEGLDIGEVDFVIIYDMPKQSIKLLQRIGRTGRKRDGKVHVLMSENREDANLASAQQTHRDIQEEILHSRNLELFEDVERLLPVGPLPRCEEMVMDVDSWDPGEGTKIKLGERGGGRAKGKTKRGVDEDEEAGIGQKGKKQRGHAIPEGGPGGFKSVADLLRDQGKMGSSGSSGKIELKVGRGRGKKGDSPTQSDSEVEEGVNLLYGDVETIGKTKKPSVSSTRGTRSDSTAKRKPPKGQKGMGKKSKQVYEEGEEQKRKKLAADELNRSALDFFAAEGAVRRAPTPPSSPPAPRPKASHLPLSPDSDPPPPARASKSKLDTLGRAGADISPTVATFNGRLTPRTAAAAGFSQVSAFDMSWDTNPTPPAKISAVQSAQPLGRQRIMGISKAHATPLTTTKSTGMMPPPPLPSSSPSTPIEATQVPRRLGMARRRPAVMLSSPEKSSPGRRKPSPDRAGNANSSILPSEAEEGVSPMLPRDRRRRRHMEESSSPVRPAANRRKRAPAAQVRELLDLDVGVSGSESSDEPSSDHETEQDRQFAGIDFQPTQAPRGYNQRAMYAAGLSTQAAPKAGLAFKPTGNKEAFFAKARKPVWISDEEADEEENDYELGSFVCNDEDISLDAQTQSDPMSGI